jgi:hypothetical protein
MSVIIERVLESLINKIDIYVRLVNKKMHYLCADNDLLIPKTGNHKVSRIFSKSVREFL